MIATYRRSPARGSAQLEQLRQREDDLAAAVDTRYQRLRPAVASLREALGDVHLLLVQRGLLPPFRLG